MIARREEAVTDALQRQSRLERRLLVAMRKVEIIRCSHLPIERGGGEENFRSRIDALAKKLERQHAAMQSVERRAADYKAARSDEAARAAIEGMEPEEMEAMYRRLEVQQTGLTHLTDIMMEDLEVVEVLKKIGEKKT